MNNYGDNTVNIHTAADTATYSSSFFNGISQSGTYSTEMPTRNNHTSHGTHTGYSREDGDRSVLDTQMFRQAAPAVQEYGSSVFSNNNNGFPTQRHYSNPQISSQMGSSFPVCSSNYGLHRSSHMGNSNSCNNTILGHSTYTRGQ